MGQAVRKSVWPLVAVLGLLYLAFDLGATQVQSPTFGVGLGPGMLRVEYVPDPNAIVNLAEGVPYTVPEGRVLIITDYTVADFDVLAGGNAWELRLSPAIRIDGVDVWGTGYGTTGTNGLDINNSNTGSASLTRSLRSGIKATAGQTVTLHSNPTALGANWETTPMMFASGYHAKATP